MNDRKKRLERNLMGARRTSRVSGRRCGQDFVL